MTQDEKRIKIAEACGWKRHFGDGIIVCGKAYVWIDPNGRRTDGLWKVGDDVQFLRVGIPNYLFDLNAMHEAEKVLSETQLETMERWLSRIVTGKMELHTYPVGFNQRLLWRATASQRAEAFGKTLNLW